MLNLKSCTFLIAGILAFNANAELIPQNVIKPLTQNENLARRAISHTLESRKEAEQSIVDRLNNLASTTVKNFNQAGVASVASWQGRQFHIKKTVSGATFNMNGFTAAHKSLPLNCLIRVTNKANGKSVVVKVNDRGPFNSNRVVDLSYAAANALGIEDTETAPVSIERID